MRIPWAVLCLVLALPVAADAHAEIFFPKLFSVDELPYTGFVFLNPDPTLATVNFYLMSASGSTVASGVLTVGAGGQVSKLGRDLLPHPGAGGWVYILNDTEGMQAFWIPIERLPRHLQPNCKLLELFNLKSLSCSPRPI